MIFLGDFNLPEVTWIEGTGFCDSDKSTLFTFCNKLVSKNMFQLIESPTRKNNILDLLITSIVESVSNINVIGCAGVALKSNHKAIRFDFHFSFRSQ